MTYVREIFANFISSRQAVRYSCSSFMYKESGHKRKTIVETFKICGELKKTQQGLKKN